MTISLREHKVVSQLESNAFIVGIFKRKFPTKNPHYVTSQFVRFFYLKFKKYPTIKETISIFSGMRI